MWEGKTPLGGGQTHLNLIKGLCVNVESGREGNLRVKWGGERNGGETGGRGRRPSCGDRGDRWGVVEEDPCRDRAHGVWRFGIALSRPYGGGADGHRRAFRHRRRPTGPGHSRRHRDDRQRSHQRHAHVRHRRRKDFQVTNLQPGSYAVRIEMPSFRTHERKNIVLSAGERFSVGTITLDWCSAATSRRSCGCCRASATRTPSTRWA